MIAWEYERTIAGAGSIEIEIRKSRFICAVARAFSEEEARDIVASIRASRWDASHNCTAWRIGAEGRLQRSSDDGEPSGTAGMPMLEVLNRRKLTDTVAIVTRYFGGAKLGAGGLNRAYGGVVSAAIDRVGVVERRILHVIAVSASHAESGGIEHALRSAGYPVRDVAYNAADVTFTLHLEPDQRRPFGNLVAEQSAGRAEVRDTGQISVEVGLRTDGGKILALDHGRE